MQKENPNGEPQVNGSIFSFTSSFFLGVAFLDP